MKKTNDLNNLTMKREEEKIIIIIIIENYLNKGT